MNMLKLILPGIFVVAFPFNILAGGDQGDIILNNVSLIDVQGSKVLYIDDSDSLNLLSLENKRSTTIVSFDSGTGYPKIIGFWGERVFWQSERYIKNAKSQRYISVSNKNYSDLKTWNTDFDIRSYSVSDNNLELMAFSRELFSLSQKGELLERNTLSRPKPLGFGNFYYFLNADRSDLVCLSPSNSKSGIGYTICYRYQTGKKLTELFRDNMGTDDQPADRPTLCGNNIYWSSATSNKYTIKRFNLKKKETDTLFVSEKKPVITCTDSIPYVLIHTESQVEYQVKPETNQFKVISILQKRPRQAWLVEVGGKKYALLWEALNNSVGNVRLEKIPF